MKIHDVLNYSILEIDQTSVKIINLLTLAILILVMIAIIIIIKHIIFKAPRIEMAKRYAIFQLIKYFLIVMTIMLGFQVLGFNISILLASSAALLVGLGLGIQNIFSDVISGIILLIDGTVKVNDVMEVNGIVCKVQDINLRTTTVLTRDDKHIILPNSSFTHSHIVNWTHSKFTSRFDITVGVDYSSDVHTVIAILERAADHHPLIMSHPAPFVRFSEYADSALMFSLYFWTNEVFRVENIKSDLRINIFDEFKKQGVHIPFPQRVIHHINRNNDENPVMPL